MERKSKKEGRRVYIWLIHFTVQQKIIQHRKATRLQLKSFLKRAFNNEQEGEGNRMGNTCKSMADSCQCMAKTTTIL